MRKTADLYKKLTLLAGDIVLITAAVSLSVAIRLRPVNVITYYTGATTFIIFSYVLCFYIFDLYSFRHRFTQAAVLTQYLIALMAGTLMSTTAFYVSLHWKFGRGIVFMVAIFVGLFTFSWRLLLQRVFVPMQRRRRVLIAGAGVSGRAIYNILKDREEYVVAGFVDDDPVNLGKEIGNHKVLGASELITQMVDNKEVDIIVVAITNEKKRELISSLLQAKLKGVGVFDMQVMYENITGKLPVSHLREGWLAYADIHGAEGGIYKLRIKRLVSFVVSLLLLLVTLPVTLIVAAAIKLDSKGPIFFRQKRVGLNGRIFDIIKFRSMAIGAEQDGAVWAGENDSRVTRAGRIIRRLRIDEIPQLWNALKGEMSLVGPRPERPEFVEDLQKVMPFYFIRHVVKPGLTGWAQVNYRYGSSREDALEKLQYDLFYVKNMSFLLDIRIILKTIRVVLFGLGAR